VGDNNIKMDIKEIECKVDWIRLAEDKIQWQAFVNMMMNFWAP